MHIYEKRLGTRSGRRSRLIQPASKKEYICISKTIKICTYIDATINLYIYIYPRKVR